MTFSLEIKKKKLSWVETLPKTKSYRKMNKKRGKKIKQAQCRYTIFGVYNVTLKVQNCFTPLTFNIRA